MLWWRMETGQKSYVNGSRPTTLRSGRGSVKSDVIRSFFGEHVP